MQVDNYPQLKQTMSKRLGEYTQSVFGKIGNRPAKVEVPLRITQVRSVDDVKDLPQFQGHSFQIDNLWGSVLTVSERLDTKFPKGFEEVRYKEYKALVAERAAARNKISRSIRQNRIDARAKATEASGVKV